MNRKISFNQPKAKLLILLLEIQLWPSWKHAKASCLCVSRGWPHFFFFNIKPSPTKKMIGYDYFNKERIHACQQLREVTPEPGPQETAEIFIPPELPHAAIIEPTGGEWSFLFFFASPL